MAHFHDFLNDLLGEEHMDNLRMDRNEIYKTNKLLRKDIAAIITAMRSGVRNLILITRFRAGTNVV